MYYARKYLVSYMYTKVLVPLLASSPAPAPAPAPAISVLREQNCFITPNPNISTDLKRTSYCYYDPHPVVVSMHTRYPIPDTR